MNPATSVLSYPNFRFPADLTASFRAPKMHTVEPPAHQWFVLRIFLRGVQILLDFVHSPIFAGRFSIALSKAVDAKLTMFPVVHGTKKNPTTTSVRIHLPLRASRPPIQTCRISGCQV